MTFQDALYEATNSLFAKRGLITQSAVEGMESRVTDELAKRGFADSIVTITLDDEAEGADVRAVSKSGAAADVFLIWEDGKGGYFARVDLDGDSL